VEGSERRPKRGGGTARGPAKTTASRGVDEPSEGGSTKDKTSSRQKETTRRGIPARENRVGEGQLPGVLTCMRGEGGQGSFIRECGAEERNSKEVLQKEGGAPQRKSASAAGLERRKIESARGMPDLLDEIRQI